MYFCWFKHISPAFANIMLGVVNQMEEIVIYKYQLETILEALRITSNIHNSKLGKTCHDRQVRQAYKFAENALKGEHKTQVSYITGK